MLALQGESVEVDLAGSLFIDNTFRIRGDGLICGVLPGGRAPLGTEHGSDHTVARLRGNSALFFHMACDITTKLRAKATRAFLKPTCFAQRRPYRAPVPEVFMPALVAWLDALSMPGPQATLPLEPITNVN